MSLEAKAERLLTTGAVHIIRADGVQILAKVQGDGSEHTVEYSTIGRRGWRCDCQAHTHTLWCSHLEAVELVATKRTNP